MSLLDAQALAFVALGSNIGASAETIRRSVGRLQSLAESPMLLSSLWRTAPVDCPPGSPDFVNAVVGFAPRAGLGPLELLTRLQAIEREFGRQPKSVLNEPRPLDLDLIAFGAARCDTAVLTLPHPRAHLRRFVLQPWSEIAPELVLPGQTANIRDLLSRLGDTETIAWLGTV